jgi:hypothetical protein
MHDRDRLLIDLLPRAAYVADGGELPKMEGHYRIWQKKYRDIAAAILRAQALYLERLHTDVSMAQMLELEELADQIQERTE